MPLSLMLILRAFANFLYTYQATFNSFNNVMVHSLVWLGRNRIFSMIIVVRQEEEQRNCVKH